MGNRTVMMAAALGTILLLSGCASDPGSVCAKSEDNRVKVAVAPSLAARIDAVAVCVGSGCQPNADSRSSTKVDENTWLVSVPHTLDEQGTVALYDDDADVLGVHDADLAWTDFLYGAPLQCRGGGSATVTIDAP